MQVKKDDNRYKNLIQDKNGRIIGPPESEFFFLDSII